jgi:small subunit ribosomal protein S1
MNETTSQANDFAAYFEKNMASMDRLTVGQSLKTTIVSIAGDTVFLELGGKSEGVLDRAELVDKNGTLTAEEGDTITVYFLGQKNGESRFTTRIAGEAANNELLENAFRNGIPVEGVVEKEIKGGYEVQIGSARGFCPFSQMGGKRGEDAPSPVGKHLTFKITEYGEKGRKLVVSNRAILADEKAARIETLKASLKEGMTVKATVVSIQKFGAFVDLSGIQALLPISEISRDRVESVETVLSVGNELDVSILKIDWQLEKITVSLKALQSDPWEGARDRYTAGSKHKGKVVRVADFGAFVSLEPGVDGLLHISEMRGEDEYGNSRVTCKKGDELTVVIKEVDERSKRISLTQESGFAGDAGAAKYLDGGPSGDTYNPFAALLKKK